MIQYKPNEIANISVVARWLPRGLEYDAFLFLAEGRDIRIAVAQASKTFISKGIEETLTFSMRMPSRAGLWHSYLEIYSPERLIYYKQDEDVLVTEAPTPEGYLPPEPVGDMVSKFIATTHRMGVQLIPQVQANVNLPGGSYDPVTGWIGGEPVTVTTWYCGLYKPPTPITRSTMLVTGSSWGGLAGTNYGMKAYYGSGPFLESGEYYYFWLQDDIGRVSFARKVRT